MSQSGSTGSYPGSSNGGQPKMSAKDLFEQRKKYSNSNVIMQETSQYHVEHLATFVMDKSEAIVTVDDAIKKLLQLESKEKIWTQEMLLQVNEKSLRLLDCGTEEELENFPLSTLHHCQTVLNQMRYSSILLLVCQDSEQSKPDIHFFNCDVEAEMIHADIESALADKKHGKKMRPQTLKVNQEKIKTQRETIIPPHGPGPTAPKPASRGFQNAKNRVIPPSSQAEIEFDRRSSGSGSQEQEETREALAQRIEKETQTLNCTLDDIEFFVAKLQKAAEAFKQLNQRKKGKKNKKKAPAEGVLTLRAKPPTEEEFIDCFQKTKLALNLLAKLKRHILNPSSAELVHFLFGPLELIVQSTGGPEVARSVLCPLLSKETTDFLKGHLTPKEMALWESMGEAWTRSRAEWPKEPLVPLYIPKFHSGWQPPLDIFHGAPWEVEISHPSDSMGQEQGSSANGFPFRKSSLKKGQSGEQMDASKTNAGQQRIFDAQGPKKYAKIRYDFTARNANELSVLRDEVLEILEDNMQWWKLRSRSGQDGYVPVNILDVVTAEEVFNHPDQVYSQVHPKYKGDLSPRGPGPALSYGGEKWTGELTGRLASQDAKDQLIHSMDEVNDELVKKIANKQPPQRNFKVGKMQQVYMPLTFDSSADDVKAWLEAKGFSKLTVSQLGILTGAQIFSLNKDELKKVCGEEGSRVYSQITVQKSQLESSQGESELQEIMKRRQEKVKAEN